MLRPRHCAALAILLFALAPARGAELLQETLESAWRDFRDVDEGETAQYIPALAAADPSHFGLVAVTVDGAVYEVGDTDVPFAIMSAAKPFTLALLMETEQQEQELREFRDRFSAVGRP